MVTFSVFGIHILAIIQHNQREAAVFVKSETLQWRIL